MHTTFSKIPSKDNNMTKLSILLHKRNNILAKPILLLNLLNIHIIMNMKKTKPICK